MTLATPLLYSRSSPKLKDTGMLKLLSAAALLCTVSAAPALAHQGLVHDGCAAGETFAVGDISVTGAFTRAMLPQAKTGGGYMSIANAGSDPDRLLGASSEAARLVQLHEMHMDGDVMKMGEIEGGIEVPAGGTVTLAPGALHVMFLGVLEPFVEGECVELVLQFERAGELPVLLPIGNVAADAAEHGGHAGH
jgi:periplasmic copper chaperone A